MKRLAQLAACGLMLVASTGCCHLWGGGCGGYGGGCGGCGNGCGYGAGYGAGYPAGAYAPTTFGTAMSPGVPVYAAGTPIIGTQTAALNPLPTY